MRVRCDRCGNKALIAASQCPHCSHLLDLRDGFGELLPMEHCTTCDTYYPARQGACRWCGTKPESFRLGPYAWKSAAVVACIGLGWGAWSASRGSNDGKVADLATKQGSTSTLTTVVDSGVAARRRAQFTIDTSSAADSLSVATIDSTPTVLVDTVSVQSRPEATPAPVPVPGPAVVESAPPPVRRARSAAARTGRGPLSSRVTVFRPARASSWVRATARNWVIVRATASPRSRIIASIGPDTRVQLGESRGEWVRIRMKGINGWVERSRF